LESQDQASPDFQFYPWFNSRLCCHLGNQDIPAERKMKILSIRNRTDGKTLKALADIELPGGLTIRDLRILQHPGEKAFVVGPQCSWKDPSTGRILYRTLITFPNQMKQDLELALLSEWKRELEKQNAGSNLQK
jgi:DNA-binding cell septation regulator SpoVG